jgi:drug/metabolite transporter (DMT)-like permease
MRTKAEIALILATFFWGLTFPFIKIVVQEISPSSLVFLRGLIATLIFAPFIILLKNNRDNIIKLIPIGFVLGFLYYVSYLSQAIGLQTITSGRSAFITNLSVIFVPLLSPLFGRGLPTKNDLISCIIAIFGIYFLTNPFSKSGLAPGDFWTLLTAVGFSFQIHILQWAMDRNAYPTVYAFLQVAFISAFSLLFLPYGNLRTHLFPTSTAAIFAITYLGVFAMVLTTWIQTRFQNQTTPERASVIYIIEPVFACFFGFLILNEKMSFQNFLGGSLIIIAVMWTYVYSLIQKILRYKIQ